MKNFLSLITIFIPLFLNSQTSTHLGIFAGGASYYGDVNPQKMFYNSSPAVGFLIRKNLNPRYSLRAMLAGSRLKGSDLDFESVSAYQSYRGHVFNENNIVELSGQLDFNFFPCTINPTSENFTPYAGIGLALLFSSDSDPGLKGAVPIAVGLKWTVSKRIELSAEWSYRKTFTDDLDGLDSYYSITSFAGRQSGDEGSSDWYSFYGAILMINLNNKIFKCPAYNE